METVQHIGDSLFKKYMNLYRNYEWTLTFADKRVADWPLMQSPIPTATLILLYLSAVYFGPKIMENRKPLQLRWVLVFYNLFMTVLNLYIAVELLVCALKRKYNWACQLVDYSDNPFEVRIAKALWWYYFSKLLEFCDTLFFILRKKNNQLSFLHIYHHSTMFGLWWIGVKWVAGGSALPGAMANSFVHVLMYLYYTLSAVGPAIQPYLWWKKYLTVIQMIQFLSAMAMGIKAIYYNCQFTRWMQYALVAYSFSFIVLFGNFYCNSYSKKGNKIGTNDFLSSLYPELTVVNHLSELALRVLLPLDHIDHEEIAGIYIKSTSEITTSKNKAAMLESQKEKKDHKNDIKFGCNNTALA